MPQPYDRIFNFSAGPSILPLSVLEQAQDEIFNFRGTGIGVMELSHRSAAFEAILAEAKAGLKELLGVPDGYQILFLQGGASLQFAMIPMNFLPSGGVGRYVLTGAWGKKAIESAKLFGLTEVAFDGKADGYRDIPETISAPSGPVAYTHFTSNETIQGVQFPSDPAWEGPLVCDMSSDILSRPVDVAKYDLIYAGAQKNMGPAGATAVIVRDEMVAKGATGLAPMLDLRLQAENDSLYNTPTTWSIYICSLVFRYLLDKGGVVAAEARNTRKATLLYDAIDKSDGFYRGHAACRARSKMTVVFALPTEELTKEFLKAAEAAELDGLKGHRSVGGIRASIYNAFPETGCVVLAELMRDFAARKG